MVGSLTGNIAQNEEKFNKLQQMMQNMAEMFQVSRQDSLDRENLLRGEISTVASRSENNVNAITAQVSSLTSTIQVQKEK